MQIQHTKLAGHVHNKKVTEIASLRKITEGITIPVFKISYRLIVKKNHMVLALKEVHKPRGHNRRHRNKLRQLQPSHS